ncbi:16631_t:CDS:2, partial [Racocetra fulgida]
DIDVRFNGEESRKLVEVKIDKDRREKFPLYFDGETVAGRVTIRPRDNKRLEHQGIKIEFVGNIELFYDRGNHYEFTALVQELAVPGVMQQPQYFDFEFKNVEKPYENTATWSLTLNKERQHYADLRQKYITSPATDNESDSNATDLSINNPLSLDQAVCDRIKYFIEWKQNEYFRSTSAQNRLLDILFIYCKMNTDVSYRQGMHELLAPILWVVDNESLSSANGYTMVNVEDATIRQALSADYVEHDTFALFSSLMKSAKVYYEYNDEVFNRRPAKIPVQREPNRIEGLVPDGFVHVTKNSAVILNKAILSAVGEVKKNVLRRPEGQYDHKKRQSTSDFPQRYAHSYQHTVHETESHQNSEDILKLKEQNRQMGIVVQRSINILEQEILVKTKSKEEVNAVDADKIEKNSDGTTSRSSFEYIAGNNNEESSIPTSNEISILNVLHGLKHVRDVLNGSVKEFNPHILDLTNNNAEDHDHWEVVDDGVSVVSMAGTEDETASVTKEVQIKQEKIVPTVNASKASISESTLKKDVETPQSSSPPLSSFSSLLTDETSSQSTSLQQSNPLADQIKISNSVDEKPSLISTTQSRSSPRGVKPTSISLPKSKVKLNDADKRSVGTPKSSITSNSKYSWILEGCTEDDDNSLFNPKRSSNVGISGLSSYSSERVNYGYLDRSIEDEDQFNKSNLTPRRSKNTERNRSESIGSVSSTNNLKKANNNVTPEIPVEDPLGVL